MSASVAVIIVNYRTACDTIRCLESLEPEVAGLPGSRVVVCDNASRDGSVARIEAVVGARGWSNWVQVLKLSENRGFAAGSNAGIRYIWTSRPAISYVMLLNPDTIVGDRSLVRLIRFMEAHPRVGVVGSQVLRSDRRPHTSARRLPSPLSELESAARSGWISRLLDRWRVSLEAGSEPVECDWVSGAAMLVRRGVFERVGLLDEGYFLYFEEVDFCRRVKRFDYEVWVVPASRVVHVEGQSTGLDRSGRRRGEYWYYSRRRFFLKTYGVGGLLVADACWAVGRAALVLRRWLDAKSPASTDPAWLTWDLVAGDLQALVQGAYGKKGRSAGSGQIC